MPLVRVAGTPEPDASPEFWQCWRQLGYAVVARAVYDYCMVKKQILKDKDGYYFGSENYKKFFHSKYFSYICPDYSGPDLLKILDNGGWQKVKTVKRFAHNPTHKPKYMPKELRGGQHGRTMES